MKTFIADLHIHSRFSRATSSRLTAPHLAAWSSLKGIQVTATGDFTHPAWRSELREALVRDEKSGLYRLRRPADFSVEAPGFAAPAENADGPLFLLEAEISSIYKRGGAVRKVHNLVYMPDFDSVERLCRKLEQIGNLASDGRPILGLDSERLLEMVLETDPRGVLIPAHIWTPWFALFGSKSGFDSIRECFGELSPHIFAMETGLSSDPDMNRLWSELDHIVMVSNSDAHSGENLGREATLFAGEPSYDGIFDALRRAAACGAGQAARLAAALTGGTDAAGAGASAPDVSCVYAGTLEFFPEEGKYHLDGHRACHVMLDPEETRRCNGRCPVCGRPLTIGVLNRVMALADRKAPEPAMGTGFSSLVPLPEIVGELLGVGGKTARAQAQYAKLMTTFGAELDILLRVPEAELRREWEALGEAISRMRAGRVVKQGGYDGEYGTVRMFSDEERKEWCTDKSQRGRRAMLPGVAGHGSCGAASAWGNLTDMLADGKVEPREKERPQAAAPAHSGQAAPPAKGAVPQWQSLLGMREQQREEGPVRHHDGTEKNTGSGIVWSIAQKEAIAAGPGPVMVVAGPGAGKTRTLVGRIIRLMSAGNVAAEEIAAITFTRRAAAEVRERLEAAPELAKTACLPRADTLHALALSFWPGEPPAVLSEEAARSAFAAASGASGKPDAAQRAAFDKLALCRETRTAVPPDLAPAAARYAQWKEVRHLADYTDLLERWLARLEAGECPRPWREVLVDEAQDLSPLQIRLVKALLPSDGAGFFGIGDPDQSIYGFRGAHPDVEGALRADWPALQTIVLRESYRSGAGVLASASALLGEDSHCGALHAARELQTRLRMFSAPDASREAAWVAEECAALLGATSHTLLDAQGGRDNPLAGTCSPADIAVLVRTRALAAGFADALAKRGVPCGAPENEAFWEEPRVALLLDLAGIHLGRPVVSPPPAGLAVSEDLWRDGPRAVLKTLVSCPPFDELVGDSSAFRKLEQLWKTAGSWEAALDWLALRRELDLARDAGERVRVMTIHAAKGLEFRAVFLPALEEGVLPFSGAGEVGIDAGRIAEERRLLYVGLTRASEAVYVSHAASRRLYGRVTTAAPSRFLADLPELFTRTRLVRHVKNKTSQMSLF